MDAQRSILDQYPAAIQATLQMLTGAEVSAHAAPGKGRATTWWESRISGSGNYRLAVGSDRETSTAIASSILSAAGVSAGDEQELRSTWLEVLDQAASSAVHEAGSTIGGKLESHSAAEVSSPDGYRERIVVVIDGSEYAIEVSVRGESAALDVRKDSGKQAKDQALAKVAGSRTISTLLGVQLPVSISFGNTRMPLKDVLKLTTGTVVELNRQPEDPVDIIVNDCVIARGEVVVVDGNYAVRIQSIIARQDRIGLGVDEADGSTVR